MVVTASQLRQNIYKLLDRVLDGANLSLAWWAN
jgi:antitoxin (DNA-binding transcriptional repressor) of toxin-antitoxin stability system